MATRRNGREPSTSSREVRAVVERYECAADQCTIFPADPEDGKRRTVWVTAEEPYFVHLADHR